MIVFCQEVWKGPITGTATHYTEPAFFSTIAQAESFALFVRASKAEGTSPTMDVELQHSNDGVSWKTKTDFFASEPLSTTDVGYHWSDDTGGGDIVGGCYMRLAITLGGTSPSAHLEMILTGRPRRLAPAAPTRLVLFSNATFDRNKEAFNPLKVAAAADGAYDGVDVLREEPTRKTPAGLPYFDLEGERENLVSQPVNFAHASWVSSATLTSGQGDPAGGTAGYDIDDQSTTAAQELHIVCTVSSSVTYVGSLWVKKDSDTSRFPSLMLLGSTGANTIVDLNTSTGATTLYSTTGFTSVAHGATDQGDWWQFFVRVRTPANTAGITVYIYPARTGTAGTVSDPTIEGSIVAWCAQLEEGWFPSSPIRGTGTDTRWADDLYVSGASDALEDTSFTIHMRPAFSSAHFASGAHTMTLIGWGTGTWRLRLTTSGSDCLVQVIDGSGSIQSGMEQAVTFSRDQECSITIRQSEGKLDLSGFTTGDGTYGNGTGWSFPTGVDIYVGRRSTGAERYFGAIGEPTSA